MICPNCNQLVDDSSVQCSFCGHDLNNYSYEAYPENEAYADEYPETENYQSEKNTDDRDFTSLYSDDGFELPADSIERQDADGRKSLSSFVQFNLTTVLALASLIVSVICLFMISSIKPALVENGRAVSSQIAKVNTSISEIDGRLSALDATVAGVQQEAYNQLAEQTITISKNIMPLTGPVAEGKYNVMFIINAKGNLSFSSCFDWQKYNEITAKWESIVFSGDYTTNDEMGLRISNSYEASNSTYITELWANGITPAAEGRYRCVITDNYGVSKSSDETSVQVQAE